MKPISPIVTLSPTEIRYSTIAKARPCSAMIAAAASEAVTLRTDRFPRPSGFLLVAREEASLDRVQLLPRVLLHRDRRELDVGELAVRLLLDPADVDVLDDVARLWVDHDRAARA